MKNDTIQIILGKRNISTKINEKGHNLNEKWHRQNELQVKRQTSYFWKNYVGKPLNIEEH